MEQQQQSVSKQNNSKNSSKNSSNRYHKVVIYADMQNANRVWEKKHGVVTAPVMVKEDNRFVYESGQNVMFKDKGFKTFLNSKYAVLPNEEVAEMTENAITTGSLKEEKIKLIKTYPSHRGKTQYWNYLGEETYSIKEGNNDKIKIGFVVRNGVGSGVALGVDLFTYRLICENGAVARGANMGTFSIRHIGQLDKKIRSFNGMLSESMRKVKDIIQYYRKATQIKVNNQLANEMYQRLYTLGETYLPVNWQIKTPAEIEDLMKRNQFKGNMNLIRVRNEGVSLWDTFNEVTQNQRDRLNQKKIGFAAITEQQNKLHQTLFAVVKQRGI